jgi:protein TonB
MGERRRKEFSHVSFWPVVGIVASVDRAHCVAIGVLLVAPLTTDLTVPGLITRAPSFVAAVAVPPPPPLVRAATTPTRLGAQAYHDGAPATAPPKIIPEDSSAAPTVPDVPVGDVSASSDLGAIVEGAGRFVAPPAPMPRVSGPLRVSELVHPPRKIVDVRPAYPAIAHQARVEGTVILEAILDRDGRIDRTRVARSIPLLDAAALDAVRQWRYTPPVLNGEPVQVLMTITIRFTLQQ